MQDFTKTFKLGKLNVNSFINLPPWMLFKCSIALIVQLRNFVRVRNPVKSPRLMATLC
jgi:hypothetical protein